MNTPEIRYEGRFMEEAVFFARRNSAANPAVERERDRLYGIQDPEARERAFHEFHRSLFLGLELGAPVEKALREQPLILSRTNGCLVARAQRPREEGAELYVAPEKEIEEKERRSVRILLRPQSLLDPEASLAFLRHELFHIADMLDPSFGYQPSLPPSEVGPTHDRLIIERYRALWDTAIDARMMRRGWLPEGVRTERLDDFRRAFPALRNQPRPVPMRKRYADKPPRGPRKQNRH